MKKKWKEFENLVAKVQAELSPESTVETNQKITGKLSKIERQIDICVRGTVGGHPVLIAIECKDHKKPVGIERVEAFAGVIEDIGAHIGIIVSAKGFTKPALSTGSNRNIRMYKLIDTNEHAWKANIKFPLVCKIKYLKNIFFNIFFSHGQANFADTTVELYDKERNKTEMIEELFSKWWIRDGNDIKIGCYDDIEFLTNDYYILLNEQLAKVKITAKFQVEEGIYFTNFQSAQLSGFECQHFKGSYKTKEITFPIEFDDIKENWQKLNTDDLTKINPILTINIVRVSWFE